MKATVIGLQGELGSGKTYFVKNLAKIMGIEEHVVSPTFIIMKVYPVDWRGFKKLIHVDAYRLENEQELLQLGWQELIADPENLILVEWPEKVEGIIPKGSKRIYFKHAL
ncbi:MAG: tRNA (adenosine(37)-N6)-threonylcarbamoyltransferase complex ATPase subunit type 1 TsaE [Candidatus Zambryskibacteria bacterium]|nr:tRNA (adenosine(37)-N6)-threonylcarbamoyltransferase complex ATPase subunit type 1 TsaE [Candidatus Zambryskibacteria bacterium]